MGENEPMENSEKRKFASPVSTLWQPFFIFFIMADADIPLPLTLGKLETQTLGGLVIGNFLVRLILKKWQPFFNFFIMANADIPHSEIQRQKILLIQFSELFHWFSFPRHPS